MKKTLILTAAVLMALVCGARAFAAGTTSNWSAKLTFSTGSTSDVYPITIGEGQAANELLKPPPLPGFAVTGNADNAVINGYVVSPSAAGQAAKSISVPATNEPGRVWPVEVYVEQAGSTVSLNVDMSNFPATGYTLSVINPDTGAVKTFSANNTNQVLFSAATAGTKTLYVMAGRSLSLLVSSGTAAFAQVHVASKAPTEVLDGIGVYVDGSQIGTTNASGSVTLPVTAISAGVHTIRVDKKYYVGSQQTATFTATGGSVVLDDIYAGDANDDGFINSTDLFILRKCYLSTATDPAPSRYLPQCDFNNDGVVNVGDLQKLRVGYRKCESWRTGCVAQ